MRPNATFAATEIKPSVLCIPEMLTEAEPNACGYLRLFLPLTKKLVRDRVDVRFATLDDLPYVTADVVVTQRTVANTQEKADRLITYCRDTGARLVFDLDDDLLSLPSHHPDQKLYEELKSLSLRLIAEADEFWASTQSLADRFLGIAQRISIVANQIDDRIWALDHDEISNPLNPVRFLYMGTSTHRPDFDQLIKPAMSELKSEFGGKIELDIIGVVDEAGPESTWSVVRRPPEIGNSYPAFVTWLQSLEGYDIGLAPLVDVPFNRCKSDIKWLEYSAMGLGTIATNLPTYSESVEHGRTGLLVSPDADGFREAMRRVIVDFELRQSLKRNARHVAREKLRTSQVEEPRLDCLLELARQPRRFGFHDIPYRPIAAPDVLVGRVDRQTLSQAFVHGKGIEIGALQKPLPLSSHAEVRYVDRMSKADLYEHYPELTSYDLVEVDIIDNGETLATFKSSSQDFIVANHFIEHCQDPIATIKNFLRVLRPGGIIYMAIPDMRRTFDQNRSRTGINHMVADHISGPTRSRKQHFREWVTLVEPHFGRVYIEEHSIEARVEELIAQDYSIHFHTFLPDDVSALVNYCAATELMPLSVIFGGEFGEEIVFILRKTAAGGGSSDN